MARFEASSDTRFLVQALAKAKPGELIAYTTLSEAIGRDVRKFSRSSLLSAVRMQLNDQRVFEAVPNEGYRLLTSEEIVKTQAAKGLSHIATTARKTVRKVASAQFNELNNAQKIQHNTQLSMLGAVAYMTKPAAMLEVQRKVEDQNKELPIGDTLRLMTGGAK